VYKIRTSRQVLSAVRRSRPKRLFLQFFLRPEIFITDKSLQEGAMAKDNDRDPDHQQCSRKATGSCGNECQKCGDEHERCKDEHQRCEDEHQRCRDKPQRCGNKHQRCGNK